MKSRGLRATLALRSLTCYARPVKIKQRPEDFVVREGANYEAQADGPVWVYRMDKQKVSTLQALDRLGKEFGVRRRALSVCGLKDKQGRTEQLVGVEGGALGMTEVVQTGDMRLTLVGRAAKPLSSQNVTANRFEVTIRDLTREEAARVPESAKEVERVGIVNYFDSQRFGFLKHGQGFIGKQLIRGDFEGALKSFLATPSELDRSDDAKVKAFWRDNWGQWRMFAPQKAGAIYAPMLRRLRQDPMDFKGAFMHIERRTRMMTLFELQSYLWNEGVRRFLLGILPPAELLGLRYQAGALIFPRSIPPEMRDELKDKTFPLLAHDSTFTDPRVQAAAVSALQSQGLALSHMKVPETPQLFFKHEERPLFVFPGKLRVSEARPDEMNRGSLKLTLSFTLPPGAYATLVVRRVLWFAADGVRELGPHGSDAAKASRARARANEKLGVTAREPEHDADEEAKPEKARKAPYISKANRALAERAAAANPKWGQPAPEAAQLGLSDDLAEPRPARASASPTAPAKHAASKPATHGASKSAGAKPLAVESAEEIDRDEDDATEEAPRVFVDPRSNGFLARQKMRKAAKEARRIEIAASKSAAKPGAKKSQPKRK